MSFERGIMYIGTGIPMFLRPPLLEVSTWTTKGNVASDGQTHIHDEPPSMMSLGIGAEYLTEHLMTTTN